MSEVVHADGHVARLLQDLRGQQQQVQARLRRGQGLRGDAALEGHDAGQVGKAVDGHAGRRQLQRGLQGAPEGVHGLAWQAVDQVQVHALEAQLPALAHGVQSVLPGLAAGDQGLHALVEILHAEGDAVEAQLPQGRQLIGLQEGGVHLDGNLGPRQELEALLEEVEGPPQVRRLQVGRRAAAPVELQGLPAVLEVGADQVQLLGHRRQVGLHGVVLGTHHHVTAAVGAAAGAEGDVQVQGQRLVRAGVGAVQGREHLGLGEVLGPDRRHGVARVARAGTVVAADQVREPAHALTSSRTAWSTAGSVSGVSP